MHYDIPEYVMILYVFPKNSRPPPALHLEQRRLKEATWVPVKELKLSYHNGYIEYAWFTV